MIPIIQYREFYDIPRNFFVRYKSKLFLFTCIFNDEIDDYPDTYELYLMPEMTDLEIYLESWIGIESKAVKKLGKIPVTSVQFGESKQNTGFGKSMVEGAFKQSISKELDEAVLDPFFNPDKEESVQDYMR